jgi:hypothetical protein
MSREAKQLHNSSLNGSYWTTKDQPRRSRSQHLTSSTASSTGLLATMGSVAAHFMPQVPPDFQNRHATMDPGSLPGSWNSTPKQEQTKTHPKQHRQPVVPGSTADTSSHDEADPDLIKALFEQMTLSLTKDIKSEMSTLRSELVPRVTALEVQTMDEQTSPDHRHRDLDKGESSRGRR